MTNKTDCTWYAVERDSWGIFSYHVIQRKNYPSSLHKVIKGPCTEDEARQFVNAQREEQFRQWQAKWQAEHAERMRTDAVYRAEHEAFVRKIDAFQEQQRLAQIRWRQQEEAHRAASYIAHAVIDAGKKAMAKKLHPDAGGDHDDMLVLENACELLRQNLPKRTKRCAHMSNYELRRRQREIKADRRKVSAGLKRELKKRQGNAQ
jgi:hypothetical protein